MVKASSHPHVHFDGARLRRVKLAAGVVARYRGKPAAVIAPLAAHSELPSADKARVEPVRFRVAVPGEDREVLTRAILIAHARGRRPVHKGRPLFLLKTVRRRRTARWGVARGGFYALPGSRQSRSTSKALIVVLASLGLFMMLSVLSAAGLAVGGAAAYAYVAKDLPSIDNIHAIEFQTTRIYDRHGALLYEMFDQATGRRTYVNVDQMPQSLIQATIAVEDETFEQNNGVDLKGIARAVYINLTKQGSSGGSTITQQLVRRVLLPEGDELTFKRKIREAILATQMTQKYSKEKILELYLNEIYYGSLAYGVDAAANTYFGKHVQDLTLAQSALLAGLPQAPGEYDPNRNFDLAKARQKIVLDQMVKSKYITRQQADIAFAEDVHPIQRTVNVPTNAPHFVRYVEQVLEQKYGVERANRGGLKVFTTIDLDWQAEAQKIATQQIDNIRKQGASNAALVAINSRTGEILAMVGSVDYTNPTFGEVNVATSLRQPGSSFKPFTYVTALERGDYTPDTILPDLPAKYTNGASSLPYVPQNYDGRFHGPVTMRAALANSYNIPAVETLNAVGVPAVLNTVHSMGISTLTDPSRYGLALTLGGGEVTLLDMTAAYSVFANGGYRVPATPFLRITDSLGHVLEELDTNHPEGKQVLNAGATYQITSILSDNAARTPAFGPNSPLKIDGIESAVKTGTTNDWKDSWTMGYTPALAVGVWVGNNDGRPMAHVAGAIGAAPIWHNFIETVYRNPQLKSRLIVGEEAALPDKFNVPPGMVKAAICATSGMAPGPACTDIKWDWFTPDNVPKDICTWHKWVPVTLHDGGATMAGPGVPKEDTIERVFTFPPPQFKSWVGGGPPVSTTVGITQSRALPLPTPATEPPGVAQFITPVAAAPEPPAARPVGLSQPANLQPIPGLQLSITSPARDSTVSGRVQVTGQASADGFAYYKLEYGPGSGDGAMAVLATSLLPASGGPLADWDTSALAPGPYVLRLTVASQTGEVARLDWPVYVTNFVLAQPTVAPSVSLITPAEGSTIFTDDILYIEAAADGGGAPVAGVEIYADGKRIASVFNPPWSARYSVVTGTHTLEAVVFTKNGAQARSAPVHVTASGLRPTPTPSPVPVLWISNLTLYKTLKPGVNEVWVDVQPDTKVQHVDIYIDGYPAGFATGPGFRVNPKWTPTPAPTDTPVPTATLDPGQAATATVSQPTFEVYATRVARVTATRVARVAAAATAKAVSAAATATSVAQTATSVAATTSPTPGPPTNTPQPTPTATFVRYQPLLDPMLGDFIARCVFPLGRHRVVAIGYDKDNHEVGRDESWVVVEK